MSITISDIKAKVLGQKDIDTKTAASTLLCTTDGGVNTIPAQVAFVAQGIDTLTTAPTVSVGTNSPDYDNLVPATSLTSLVATGLVKQVLLENSFICTPGTEIYLNVSTAAVATTFDLMVGVEVAEQ